MNKVRLIMSTKLRLKLKNSTKRDKILLNADFIFPIIKYSLFSLKKLLSRHLFIFIFFLILYLDWKKKFL